MVIIAVDDEKIALEGLVSEIKKAVPDADVYGFRSANAALKFVLENECDVAFLDIEMRGMNGVELAKVLKMNYPGINIVFATGYDEYMKEAFGLHASGYIMKPVTEEKIRREMEELRHPVVQAINHAKKGCLLKVRTFGNFEIFVDGKPLKFSRNKSKELFAYLVHKCGTSCSTKELITILFEDSPYTVSVQKQFQTILSTMIKTLKDVNADDCIIRRRNQTAVDIGKIDCDYYHYLEGNPAAINAYTGEYMANYSWAEFVLGYLDQKL
ncbi:MAG: response regulator [Lachnospiraceae bacterium]